MFLILASNIILFIYIVIIIVFIISWRNIKVYPWSKEKESFSIIIPFRNEETRLPLIIEDLENLLYPFENYEVIFVNDESEDMSVMIVREWIKQSEFKVRLLNSFGGKKKAINKGVLNSKFDIIIQQDADNRVKPDFLESYNAIYQSQSPRFVSGPVVFEKSRRFLKKVFEVEFSSLIISGAASLNLNFPTMSNGANMSYLKDDFFKFNASGDGFSSGDDIFLMNSIKNEYGSDKIYFLKNEDAVVESASPDSLLEFFRQRIRWTSKDRGIKDFNYLIFAFLILIVNLFVVVNTIAFLSGNINFVLLISYIGIKFIFDSLFIYQYLKFSGRKQLIIYTIPAFVLSNVYIVIVGIFGHFIKPKWKGRKID